MSSKSQQKSRASDSYSRKHESTIGRKALQAAAEPAVLEPIADLREFQHVARVLNRINERKAKAAKRAALVAYRLRKPCPSPNMTQVLVAVPTKKGNDTLLMLDNGQVLSVRRYLRAFENEALGLPARRQNADLERRVLGFVVKQRAEGKGVTGEDSTCDYALLLAA